jgi:glyoxylase-like metal-dependent hydrolase (beta-lactamase superfamily II)
MIDPVALEGEAWSDLLELAAPIAIVLTNGNHARDAASARQKLSVPILAHPAAHEDLEILVDGVLEEGSAVAGDLQVIEIPGAGPGEVAIYAPERSLHIGDAVINMGSHGFTFLPDKYCQDPKTMRLSLRRLLPLRFSLATFAHGLPIAVGASQQFSRLLS